MAEVHAVEAGNDDGEDELEGTEDSSDVETVYSTFVLVLFNLLS
jgi:hypothetical protein